MISTKDQERAARKKIEAILESLGENSYVATAFTGCLEIAAENIENDFACSMQDQRDSARREAETLRGKLAKMIESAKDQESSLSIANRRAEERERVADSLRKRAELAERTMRDEADRAGHLAEKCKRQAEELVTLKARLYDLITK